MAIIKSITVEGWAETGAFSAKMNERVNAFHGVNGAGEVWLTKCLYSALSGDVSVLDFFDFKSIAVQIHSGNRTYMHTLENPIASDAGAARDPLHRSLAWRVEQGGRDGETPRCNHVYLPTSRVYSDPLRPRSDFLSSLEPMERCMADLLHSLCAGSLITVWKKYDLEFQLRRNAAISDGHLKILNTIFSKLEIGINPTPNIDPDTAYERVKWFVDAMGAGDGGFIGPDAFKKDFEENGRSKRIAHYASEAFDAFALVDEPREQLKKLIGGVLGEGKRASFSSASIDISTGSDETIPLEALALGEINAMLLLVASMSVWEGVVLIDYPEFSLHVDFQRILVKLMRMLNPDVQIIMATHSPAILNNLEPDMHIELDSIIYQRCGREFSE